MKVAARWCNWLCSQRDQIWSAAAAAVGGLHANGGVTQLAASEVGASGEAAAAMVTAKAVTVEAAAGVAVGDESTTTVRRREAWRCGAMARKRRVGAAVPAMAAQRR